MKGTENVTSAVVEIPSGFPQYRTAMFLGFVAMTALYCVCIATFDSLRKFLHLPPSASEFCQPLSSNDDGSSINNMHSKCWRADLFAFEVSPEEW
jgi:hypothetical protein